MEMAVATEEIPFSDLGKAQDLIRKLDVDLDLQLSRVSSEHMNEGADDADQASRYQALLEKEKVLTDIIESISVKDQEEEYKITLQNLVREGQLLKKETEEIQKEIRETEEKIEEIQQISSNVASKARDEDSTLETERKKLDEYCSRCVKFLGFDVRATKHRTFIFEFHNWNGINAEKKFWCEVKTSYDEGAKPFEVIQCHPDLGSSLEKLEGILNTTRDLSGFVFSLRNMFIKTLKSNEK